MSTQGERQRALGQNSRIRAASPGTEQQGVRQRALGQDSRVNAASPGTGQQGEDERGKYYKVYYNEEE